MRSPGWVAPWGRGSIGPAANASPGCTPDARWCCWCWGSRGLPRALESGSTRGAVWPASRTLCTREWIPWNLHERKFNFHGRFEDYFDAPVCTGVCVRSWSSSCANCMNIRVYLVCGKLTSSWMLVETRRALGSGSPVTESDLGELSPTIALLEIDLVNLL